MVKYIIVINENDTNDIIIDRVKRYNSYFRIFDNVFIIETDKTAEEIYNEIVKDYTHTRIVICEINSEHYWGMFNKELWGYLK